MYLFDGARVLSVPGEYWWQLESETLDGIAFGILFNHTADREVSEARAKAFALELLGPLAKPTHIVASAIDQWLLAAPSRPAPIHRRPQGPLTIPCVSCGAKVPTAARHFALVSVFGTRCDGCRAVAS